MTEFFGTVLAVILHEAGHILVAKLFGIRVNSLSLNPIGASLSFDFSSVGYIREGLVHLAGPLFGILCAASTYIFFGSTMHYFFGISTVLSAVNLLPITGFDGGALLKCILSLFFTPDSVSGTCRVVSYIFLIILWAGVLWIELRVGANLSLLAFVLFFMLKSE